MPSWKAAIPIMMGVSTNRLTGSVWAGGGAGRQGARGMRMMWKSQMTRRKLQWRGSLKTRYLPSTKHIAALPLRASYKA